MTIIVHHLNKSRSHRIIWLLEELNVQYEVKEYFRDKETVLAPPELKKVHPLGKSPIIEDTEINAIIAESGAIVEYIIGKFGNGKMIPPPDTPERLRYTYWLHYSEANIMMLNIMALVFGRMPEQAPFFMKPLLRAIANKAEQAFYGPQLKMNLEFIESELGKSTWFAGEEVTGADVMMSFPVQLGIKRGNTTGMQLPRMKAFLKRIEERPAYKRAIEKVGSLEIL